MPPISSRRFGRCPIAAGRWAARSRTSTCIPPRAISIRSRVRPAATCGTAAPRPASAIAATANGSQDGKKVGDPAKARVKALEGHIDPMFRGWDLNYPDVKRAERFIEELHRFERDGGFPSLTILRLPNDHTSGTKAGAPTPRAQVADNDLALGMVVGGRQQEQVLEGHGHLRRRGRRPERPRSRGRPPRRRPGRQSLHEARTCGFDDVLDKQHVADDGIDSRPEADEPVRRGGPADVSRLPGQARR